MRRALNSLICAIAWAASASRAAAFDFTALQSLLQDHHIDSVEQLIAALPAAQRSHYALMFESRSLQGASYEHPRVILFGTDVRFIVAFNGNSDQRGFNTVETMEFDNYVKEFRLRELAFGQPTAGHAPLVISEPNPPRCARCHGTPPQPVWDTLPLWPGAYGERYRTSLSSRERAGLSTFLAQQAMHPRYRYLLDTQRLADPQTFRPSAVSNYSGLAAEPPNAELAVELSRLQSQAVARQLARQPAFPLYQYTLLGVVDNACGQLADFYPAALWLTQRRAFERFAADTASANARQARFKAARTGGGARLAFETVSMDNAWVPIRFVAETALGVSTRAWTLALERGTYDFTLPSLSAQQLRDSLLAEVATRDPTVRELNFYSSGAGAGRYCSYLQRHSVAALSPSHEPSQRRAETEPASLVAAAAATDGLTASVVARPTALQLCINCHESGAAPPLPFSDPQQLAQQLRSRPAAHGTLFDEMLFRLSSAAGPQRMPLGINLSDTDRQALENYFTTVVASSN